MTNFFSGKKVFITGHTGFKGSWLCLWLHLLGAKVYGYSLDLPTKPNLFELGRVAEVLQWGMRADVCDRNAIATAMQNTEPDIVIHMAAQALVRRSYKDPVHTFDTNVMGTVNVLEAVRRCKSVKAVVVITSDKVYANKGWPWGYREIDRIGGDDPYSASKACAEMATHSYRTSFLADIGVGTARAGNVIGGGDWAEDRLLPDCMRAWLEGKDVSIRNQNAVRPWQHVLDPLAGYLQLAESLYHAPELCCGPWNFGPKADDMRPVSWIVYYLHIKLGLKTTGMSIFDQASSMPEANALRLDSSKAKQVIGWQPKWNIESALDKTVEWWQAYKAGEDMRAVCVRQIEEYSRQ